MSQVTIVCLCGNEYEGDVAELSIEPRCPECHLKFANAYPDKYHMSEKYRQYAEQYVKELRMQKKPLIYFASPYSHDDKVIRVQRYRQMTEVLVRVINEQDAVIPFSPIVYTHPIDYHVNRDFDWVEWDLHYLDRCDAMIVVMLDGWTQSEGVQAEIKYCKDNDIPYALLVPDDILEACKYIGQIYAAQGFIESFDADEKIVTKHADGNTSVHLRNIKS